MTSGLTLRSDPPPLRGLCVADDIRRFGQLIEAMECELAGAWADMSIQAALNLLASDAASAVKFITLALSARDGTEHHRHTELVKRAVARDIAVVLVVEEQAQDALKPLIQHGARNILPYPLADGALRDTLALMETGTAPHLGTDTPIPSSGPRLPGHAAIFAVQALAGGTGASTLAVNLAWELATIDKRMAPNVCLFDLNLQDSTISAYLDLPRRDAVIELLQEAQDIDAEAFKQALVGFEGRLSVLVAPPEIVPLDIIGPTEVEALLALAAECFDIVVIDMPSTLVLWTETVLARSDVYFATLELDMRSAQNALRFQRALKSEGLQGEKVNFVLNRAPGLVDLAGRSRLHLLADTLGANISTRLPDGGHAVTQAGDRGVPLAEMAPKSPLRREVRKLAQGLYKSMIGDRAMVA